MPATVRAFSLATVVAVLGVLALLTPNPAVLIASASALAALAAALAGRSESYSTTLWSLLVDRSPRHARVPEGTPLRVTVAVRNPTGRGLPLLILRDHTPPRARAGEPLFQGSLPGGGVLAGSYEVAPAPGLARVEEATLEARDPLGLYSESRRVRVVTTLQSYPRPYPPAVERAGAGLGLAEALASRRAGAGTEFYSLRDYVPGDDVRLVAWLASARAGRPVVRENVEERRLDLCIIADLSLEAWAGSPGESAADWAMRASLALVEASARTAGRVSYSILLGETALWLEPRRAPEAGESMAEAFASTSPSHAAPRSGLGRVLRVASEEWPSGCVLVALLGPGGLGDAVTGSPDTWEAISRVAWRMVAVELLPTGATVLEEWLRRSYTRLEEPYLERLRRAGAAAFIAPTPRHLAAALTVGVSSAASRLHGPLAR